MSDIRAEVSKKNPYWIDKHRYYELKHFCLQYNLWKKKRDILDGINTSSIITPGEKTTSSSTEKTALKRMLYSDRIQMIEETAKRTDPVIGSYILTGVTEGLSFDKLNARSPVPCGKDKYYDLYRRFFWLLSRARK